MEILDNPLKTYFLEIQEDGATLGFHCVADDPEHATEQAYDAYPGCIVSSCRVGSMSPYSWHYQLGEGSSVYWRGSAAGDGSGVYRIAAIQTGRIFDAACLVTLVSLDGETRRVRPEELSSVQPSKVMELTIRVQYDPAGQTTQELAATLYHAADHLFFEGMLSWGGEATVLDMQASVKEK